MSLDAIGIISKDIDKTVEFYELLDVHLKQVGGPGHLEGTTSSGVRIMIDSVEVIKAVNPTWEESTGVGIVLCFIQDTPEMVNELVKKISEAGFKVIKEPWDAFWGQRYASVSDPNGNQIDIFSPL